MPQFMQLLMSNPGGFAAAGAALQGTGAQFTTVGQGFTAGTNTALATWQGASKDRAQAFAERFAKGLSGMATQVRQAGGTATQGGNALQGMVTTLRTSTQTAQAAGFLVLPGGQVMPGPAHYAEAAAAGPGAGVVLQAYQIAARLWTTYFSVLVQTATVEDQAIARAIQGITLQLDSELPFRSSVRAPQWFGGNSVLENNQIRGRLGNELNDLWTRMHGEQEIGTERMIRREPGSAGHMFADRITVDANGGVHLQEAKAGGAPLTPAQQDILPRIPRGGPEVAADGMAPVLPQGTVLRPGDVSAHVQRWDVDSLPQSARDAVYRNGYSLTDILNGRAGAQASTELSDWIRNPASQVRHTL